MRTSCWRWRTRHAGADARTLPDGPQYLVVAAGGDFSSQLGDWIIAYALPAEAR